jgi:hypothetical protein
MTGIMVAMGALLPTVSYANGLYNTTYGVELSPIDIGTQSSQFSGAVSLTYQWIGYYRPASSSAIQLGAVCNYQEYYNYFGSNYAYNWGGGGNSTCYIWTGAIAKSGYNGSNYTALIQNGSGGSNFTATADSYVPMRIQWSTVLPYLFVENGFYDVTYFAQSNFAFTIASTSSISGRIFYNSLTNGF